jgi:hypothetical protein
VRNTRSVLLSDEGVRVAVVLLVLSCVLIVTLVLLTSAAGEALVGWFYFATVDYREAWTFGPFDSLGACLDHRAATVPLTVETTVCVLMNVEE